MSGARLGLGTVQWGTTYGIANRAGRPRSDEIRRMLTLGRERGVQLLDTAYAYGDAQRILGEQRAAERGYRIVTKTKPLRVRQVCDQDVRELAVAFDESLAVLGVAGVYGLLVHGASALRAPGAEDLWSVLEALRREGRVAKIGVSVYHPDELRHLLDRYSIDLVQLPFNVYDQRFKKQGLLARLRGMGIEVHARSIFLQGLLLLRPDELPPAFGSLRVHQASLHERALGMGLTPVECCLQFGLQQSEIDTVVVGCETESQLAGVLDASAGNGQPELSGLASFGLENTAIVDPSEWVH